MTATRLLLHVCCGPCAIMPILRLRDDGFKVIAWFMNPNIQPLGEYLRRREALTQCAEKLDLEVIYEDTAWDIGNWLAAQLPVAKSPDRCLNCCSSRVKKAAEKATEMDCQYFTTSLLYSRYQPHDAIAAAGHEFARQNGLDFVYRDFRIDWQAGIDFSREWGIYRQPYCGCVFSEAERYAKKLARVAKKDMADK